MLLTATQGIPQMKAGFSIQLILSVLGISFEPSLSLFPSLDTACQFDLLPIFHFDGFFLFSSILPMTEVCKLSFQNFLHLLFVSLTQ